MGCCTSKSADSKASRTARWRSTGIVALRDSKLKTFPDEVLDLERSVRTLDLTNNKLVDVPTEINKLINLQRLVLTENVIERLPMNLGKLQYLKVMALDGNRITTLPDEFGQLVKLEKLSISRNLLLNLPETIGSLRNLMLLDVSNNKIKFLPESIGSCFSLEEIQANENSIEELPLSVCNLVHLKSLSLDNNTVKQCRKETPQVTWDGGSMIFHAFCYEDSWDTSHPSPACLTFIYHRAYLLQFDYEEDQNRTHEYSVCRTQIPPNLLKDCKSLQNISLHGNPISMDDFQQMEGFGDFEGRRKRKFDKLIDSNVMINSKGLDEGVDL